MQISEENQIRVFVSYSRKNSEFVDKLIHRLEVEGFLPDFDRSDRDQTNIDSGIAADDEWWLRIQQMIASSDMMVFVVSPDSANSSVCDMEIDYARQLGKRVVPILVHPVEFSALPPVLAAFNIKLSFVDNTFEQAFQSLSSVLLTDIRWYRTGRSISQKVNEWDQMQRPTKLLLRKEAVEDAMNWAARRSDFEIGPLMLEYLSASRAKNRRDENRRSLMKRVAYGLGLAFVTITIFTFLNSISTARKNGETSSTLLAQLSELRLQQGDYKQSLLLAFASVNSGDLNRPSSYAVSRLSKSLILSPIEFTLQHSGHVNGAVFSADGSELYTWSSDGSIRIWNANTGRAVRVMTHGAEVLGASYSPESESLLSWSLDRSAVVWNLDSGEQEAEYQHDGSVTGATYSPNGEQVLTWSTDDTVKLWTLNGDLIAAIQHSSDVKQAFFSRDGSKILSWSANPGAGRSEAYVWNSSDGSLIMGPLTHFEKLRGATFSPDNLSVLTWSGDGAAKIWNQSASHEPKLFALGSPVTDCVFIDQNRVAMSGEDGRIVIWNYVNDTIEAGPPAHINAVSSVEYFSESNTLQTISFNAVSLWNLDIGEQIWSSRMNGEIIGVKYSSEPAGIWAWGYDHSARFWDLENPDKPEIKFEHQTTVRGMTKHPTRDQILLWSDNGIARLWNLNRTHQINRDIITAKPIFDAHFDAQDNTIYTWSVDPRENSGSIEVWRGADHEQYGLSVDIPNGGASGRMGFEARRLIFLKEGRSTLEIRDMLSGEVVGEPHSHPSRILSTLFSPDDTIIVTSSLDGLVKFWNSSDGSSLSDPLVFDVPLLVTAWSKDNSRIFGWNPDSGGSIHSVNSPSDRVRLEDYRTLSHDYSFGRAEFIDENSTIVATTNENITLWKSNNGLLSGQLNDTAHHHFSLSTDEALITTWLGNRIKVFDARTTEQVGTTLTTTGEVSNVQFFKDKNYLLVITSENTAFVLDSSNDQVTGPLLVHRGNLFGASIDQESGHIFTWSEDGTLRRWDIRLASQELNSRLISELCHRKLGAPDTISESRILSSFIREPRFVDERAAEELPALGPLVGKSVCAVPNGILSGFKRWFAYLIP